MRHSCRQRDALWTLSGGNTGGSSGSVVAGLVSILPRLKPPLSAPCCPFWVHGASSVGTLRGVLNGHHPRAETGSSGDSSHWFFMYKAQTGLKHLNRHTV